MTTKQFDQLVENQLDLFRTSTVIEKDVLRLLLKLQKDLTAEVAASTYTAWGKARVNRQLAEVKDLIKSYYDKASQAAQEGTSAIAEVTARATAKSLSIDAVLPTNTMLEAIASQSVIQGAAQGRWWARQAEDTAFRFAQAVRMGLVNAETNQQIIARVRGFLDTSRQGAAALVQTSAATVASESRKAVYAANDDIILRYRAVATLDSHTCATCAPLDGMEWEKDGSPIGHKFPLPSYPKHFNCRCLTIPVVAEGEQGGKRASEDGPVKASLNFSGWLSRQSTEKQTSILGKGRAELYQQGKITITDLVRGNGSPLTLKELRQKYS